jgi:hypothetical protein
MDCHSWEWQGSPRGACRRSLENFRLSHPFSPRWSAGSSQISKTTLSGRRVIDNLANGVARESKMGRTYLTKRVRSQIEKDVLLRSTRGTGVKEVEWHFFTGKTGIGPSVPLARALDQANIRYFLGP